MRRAGAAAAVTLLALLGAPLGHALAYGLRYGSRAAQLQAAGSHSYFPAALATAAALLGAALILALLVVGMGRLMLGARSGKSAAGGCPIRALAVTLLSLQLAIFVGQEHLEAWAAGRAAEPLLPMLLWGLLGQGPVAFAAAVALAWVSVRFGDAVAALLLERRPRLNRPAPLLPPVSPASYGSQRLLCAAAPAVFVKRGPPPDLLVTR